MPTEKPLGHLEYLDSILLKGKVLESRPNESITLEAQGATLTVRHQDVKRIRDISNDEKELLVSASAKIIYEALLNPAEAEGILSQDMMVRLTVNQEPTECSRCVTECSRCVTECSRCATATTGLTVNQVPTECSRCVTECSRCATATTGLTVNQEPTECSRCVTECSRCVTECSRCANDTSFGGLNYQLGNVYRRRIS